MTIIKINFKSIFNRYLIMALSLLVIMGCFSSVPYQVFHEASTQKKMQAAKHWDILASDVAEQLAITLPKYKEIQATPCIVKSSDETPFGKLFDRLLIAHLIEKGFVIASKHDNAVIIDYSAKVLGHAERMYNKVPIKYTALGIGVNVARNIYHSSFKSILPLAIPVGVLLDAGTGGYAGNLPSNEVIIYTSLTYNNRIYFQQADIYYINDPDWWHYDNKPYVEGKKYEITDK